MFGFTLGTYSAEICDACGEYYVDLDDFERMEARAKKLGIWGLGKKVTIAKSGNSLVVRIPTQLARFLGVRAGLEAFVRPEGRESIVVELG